MHDNGKPPGWFDTRRRGTRRWWDGTRWTSHITVHGRATTVAEETASVRRQLLVGELVLVGVLVGSILIALWGALPVVVVRPVIVAGGIALVVMPLAVARRLRLLGLPARRSWAFWKNRTEPR